MADISSPRFITIRGALPEVRESDQLLLDLLLRRLPAHGRKGTAEGRHVRKSDCPASISPYAQEGRSRGVREASECGWSSTPALRLIGYRLVLTPAGRVVFGHRPHSPRSPGPHGPAGRFPVGVGARHLLPAAGATVGEELARHDHGTVARNGGVKRSSKGEAPCRWQRVRPGCRLHVTGSRRESAQQCGSAPHGLTSASFCASSVVEEAGGRWASYNVQLLTKLRRTRQTQWLPMRSSASYIVVDTGPCRWLRWTSDVS